MQQARTTLTQTEQLEADCADAWGSLVESRLGQWRLRAADGFTGRANSALVIGTPDRPIRDALDTATEFAGRHGVPPTLQVPAGAPVEPALAEAGWRRHTEHSGPDGVLVMTGPLTALTGAAAPGETEVTDEPPADWWPVVGDEGKPGSAEWHVLTNGGKVGFAILRRTGRAAGAVRGSVVGDLLHIARLAVSPEFRRQGIAGQVLAGLADWAADLGATRYALQVMATNHAAIALYERLGAVEHHRYHYWIPDTPAQ
ncbi:MAG TPA: GNAT family N-acetyltransferase [Pseudonocardiaceae bacterium]|nr:GNAT family N-acetyltransferase [Pseudonocardiaceae bacterium]